MPDARRPAEDGNGVSKGRHPGPATIGITVDGRTIAAEAGSSLLAALWNAGILPLRRSVSGEARGAFCGMGVCFECRVTVDGVPHTRACTERVRQGMEVRTLG